MDRGEVGEVVTPHTDELEFDGRVGDSEIARSAADVEVPSGKLGMGLESSPSSSYLIDASANSPTEPFSHSRISITVTPGSSSSGSDDDNPFSDTRTSFEPVNLDDAHTQANGHGNKSMATLLAALDIPLTPSSEHGHSDGAVINNLPINH